VGIINSAGRHPAYQTWPEMQALAQMRRKDEKLTAVADLT